MVFCKKGRANFLAYRIFVTTILFYKKCLIHELHSFLCFKKEILYLFHILCLGLGTAVHSQAPARGQRLAGDADVSHLIPAYRDILQAAHQ